MNGVNFLEKLLDGVEVEWKALGEIGTFIRGRRFTKVDYVDEGISVIHYGEIYTQYGVWADHAISQVRSDIECCPTQDESAESAVPDKKAGLFSENS